MATDNLVEAAIGALEGFNSAFVPFQKAKYDDALLRNRRREANVDDLSILRQEIPLREASTQRLSEVDVPQDIATDFDMPAGRMDKELLGLYKQRSINNRLISVQGKNDPNIIADTMTAKEEAKRKVKLQGALPKARSSFQASDANLQSLIDSVDELLGDKGLASGTGKSGAMALIPGTKARDIKAKIQTLKSKTSLNALQEMRNNSPTGGALGNVSDAESTRLENNIAALDTGQSDEEFVNQLKKLRQSTVSAQKRVRDAFRYDFGDLVDDESESESLIPSGGVSGGSGLSAEQRRARIAELRARQGR